MPYVTADVLDERVAYDPDQFFDHNEEERFQSLLETLEEEAVGLVESRLGDVTYQEETDKVQDIRATDDAALLLEFPVNDVSQVEVKRTVSSDWEVLDEDRYTWNAHRLILAERSGRRTRYGSLRTNPLTRHASRATWGDLYAEVRVTYDRGFDPLPPDFRSIVVSIVNKSLRNLRNEQAISAADPGEMESIMNASAIMTEDIAERIDTITTPGGATMSM